MRAMRSPRISTSARWRSEGVPVTSVPSQTQSGPETDSPARKIYDYSVPEPRNFTMLLISVPSRTSCM
jgi:hypothetical protein